MPIHGSNHNGEQLRPHLPSKEYTLVSHPMQELLHSRYKVGITGNLNTDGEVAVLASGLFLPS